MTNIPVESNQGTPPKWDHCAFPFFGNVGTPLMATLNIPGLTIGLPIWLWSTLNILNVIEASHMTVLFQGYRMGVNCSCFAPNKSRLPLSPPSCNNKSKKKRKRKNKKKNSSLHESSPTSSSHVGDDPSATTIHARVISLVTAY